MVPNPLVTTAFGKASWHSASRAAVSGAEPIATLVTWLRSSVARWSRSASIEGEHRRHADDGRAPVAHQVGREPLASKRGISTALAPWTSVSLIETAAFLWYSGAATRFIERAGTMPASM